MHSGANTDHPNSIRVAMVRPNPMDARDAGACVGTGEWCFRRAMPRLWVVGWLALLVGCSPAPDPLFEQTFYVFGTLVDLTLWGISEPLARSAATSVEADLQAMHRDWHAWQPGELTRLNQAIARGEPFQASPHMITLIRTAQEAERRSAGTFNPAIGHLIGLWGFHQDIPPSGPPPTQAEIAAWVAKHPSTLDLTIEGNTVRSRNPAVELDFGGIAKGYAGDLIIAKLRTMGIQNAILDAGGGLQVTGRHGDRPWHIGIRDPMNNNRVFAAVDLGPATEGMNTSGGYARFREYNGKRYSHILDPRTGMPVEDIVSATVIYPDGIWSDASTKGMVVGGVRCWSFIAGRMGLTSVLLVDARGTVYMTPEMRRRVHLEQEPARVVVQPPGTGGSEVEKECEAAHDGR